MVRGLYTAWTGLQTEQKRLDVIANNMANSATVGFKAENVTNQSFAEQMALKINDASERNINRSIGTMSLGVKLGEVYTDYSQGSLRETSNDLDLALSGPGFFVVNTSNDNQESTMKFTRDGTFTMNREGYVVDSNGCYLQGESGNLQIPVDTANLLIDGTGAVYADEQYIDHILVKDFEDYSYLQKFADNMYSATPEAMMKDASASIVQGYTEQSNVNVISEMVEMINITRAYEANQKVLQTIDSSLDQVVNTVGKI